MRKIFFISFMMGVSSTSIPITQTEREAVLQETVLQLIDGIELWKETAKIDIELIGLLDQVIAKLQDGSSTVIVRALYGLMLPEIHQKEYVEQKALLKQLLSKSSDELMKEAAVMIQIIREQQN